MYASSKREHGEVLGSSPVCGQKSEGVLVTAEVPGHPLEEKKNKILGLMFRERCRRSPGPGPLDPGSGIGGTGRSGHS